MTKRKRTNDDLQHITQKNKDRVTQTPLTTGGELRCSGRVSRSCSTCGTGYKFDTVALWKTEFQLHPLLTFVLYLCAYFMMICSVLYDGQTFNVVLLKMAIYSYQSNYRLVLLISFFNVKKQVQGIHFLV